MTQDAVHASPAAGPNTPATASFAQRHKRSFAVTIIIGAIMAVIAPLQTHYISFWPRLLYWEILMLSGATIGLGVTEGMKYWGRLDRWPWLEVPVTGLLIALPLTMIVIGTSTIFFGVSASGTIRFSFNFFVTAVISIAITALNHMLHAKDEVRLASPPVPILPPALEQSRFAERLPLGLRGQPIIALQAEDHYLRVHLGNGQSTLILMRLSDAMAELSPDQGAQTHRSWWVAKAAVRAVSKADGRATLTLDHAIEAPVSRSFYKALNDAAWLR
jgi:hypothetical protein